jgi:transposase
MVEIFQVKAGKERGDKEQVIDELYRQIGQLKVENEWLKKKSREMGS